MRLPCTNWLPALTFSRFRGQDFGVQPNHASTPQTTPFQKYRQPQAEADAFRGRVFSDADRRNGALRANGPGTEHLPGGGGRSGAAFVGVQRLCRMGVPPLAPPPLARPPR